MPNAQCPIRATILRALTACVLVGCGEDVPELVSHRVQLNSNIVYSWSTRHAQGASSQTTAGALSPTQWRKNARPWLFAGSEEPLLFVEDARAEFAGSELIQRYTVTTELNSQYGRPESPRATAPQFIDSRVVNATSEVEVEVRLAVPRLPVILSPPEELYATPEAARADLSTAQYEYATAEHIAQQQLQAFIERMGITDENVLGGSARAGALHVKLTPTQVSAILHEPRLLSVRKIDAVRAACNGSCNQPWSGEWTLGAGHDDQRIGSQVFHGNGYDGGITNPSRHSYGALVASVIEVSRLEDEGCYLDDGSGCDSRTQNGGRLDRTYQCLSFGCFMQSNQDDENDPIPPPNTTYHGTIVSGILLGHFEQNQAAGFSYGDDCWDGVSHCSDWEAAGRGMAYESWLHYYTTYSTYNSNNWFELVLAFQQAAATNTDVINASLLIGDGMYGCTAFNQSVHTAAAEDAFDSGAFVVVAAGNDGLNDGCNIGSLPITPKTFAVNGLLNNECIHTAQAWGGSYYRSCVADDSSSSLGGVDINVNGTWRPNALAAVDLIAPARVRAVPGTYGPNGHLRNYGGNGSSFAAPHVAGAALLVKDFFLSHGHTWVNYPGRLQAIMLGMGDRAVSKYGQGNSGINPIYGAGRLKLRLFESGGVRGPWGWNVHTKTISSASPDYHYMPFDYPIPAGAELLKCSSFEVHDVNDPDVDELGDVFVGVKLRSSVGGLCSASGALVSAKWDSSFDTRHLVAITDSTNNIEGLCPEIEVANAGTDGPITISTFCYYAGIMDNEPY